MESIRGRGGPPSAEDWRLPIDDRTKRQVPSFMSLLKPPSPLRIAANRRSRPGFGIRRSGFEKKEGTGLAEEGRRQGSGLRDSRGVTVNLRGQSVDSTMVVGQVAQPKKPRHDELKGLI